MAAVIASTQNWAAFATTFEPLIADKEAFAVWTSGTKGRYLYACWDTDVTDTQTPSAYVGIGAYLKANALAGTAVVYPDPMEAAFVLGITASIDFNRHNARLTYAFRACNLPLSQITDETIAANLTANGINFYGSYATANQNFINFQTGQVSGPYGFIDSYVNSIWLTNNFQLALMELLTSVGAVPYNNDGYGLIKAALKDPIDAGLNFGAIRKGVTLSALQASEVNMAAGVKIDNILSSQGWFLQVLDPGAQVRGQRGTPICTFWYMDGEAVQKIVLASIDVL